jgi:hypothetical protein
MSVGLRQIGAVKVCVRRSVQVDHYIILRTPMKGRKFDFLSAGTARLAATYPGEIPSPPFIHLCRCSQIFDPEIDLQKVRKRSKVLIRRVSF